MLAELRTERENIDQAIITLEQLAAGQGRRRGRPPAWMKNSTVSAERGQYNRTPEVRARMAEAQRKRWAERKAAEAKK